MQMNFWVFGGFAGAFYAAAACTGVLSIRTFAGVDLLFITALIVASIAYSRQSLHGPTFGWLGLYFTFYAVIVVYFTTHSFRNPSIRSDVCEP